MYLVSGQFCLLGSPLPAIYIYKQQLTNTILRSVLVCAVHTEIRRFSLFIFSLELGDTFSIFHHFFFDLVIPSACILVHYTKLWEAGTFLFHWTTKAKNKKPEYISAPYLCFWCKESKTFSSTARTRTIRVWWVWQKSADCTSSVWVAGGRACGYSCLYVQKFCEILED